MKKIRISELPLSESTKGLYLLATDSENKSVKVSMDSMSEERAAADAELLKRIIGKSTFSSAYTDPFKYLDNFASEKDENGTITKNAIRVMQDYLLDTLRHSDFRDSFPYIGKMRAHVEGVPIEAWNYVKSWNTGSTNGVFVQVVRTNFGIKNGVISSALTEAFHEYFRTVTVGIANGSVTDVTATPWKESTVTEEQEKKLNIITELGHFTTRDALLAAAAKINVVQLSSDNGVRILYGTYTDSSTNSVLILQHNTRTGSVIGSGNGTTMQYVFDGKERYTRYIVHNASSVTAVQPLQREGVRNLYFTPKGFIGLRDMWGTQVGSGFFLPDNTAIREDAANTTATSVGLIITSFLGTTKTATLGAVTSARAGLMTVALYNELKQATEGVAAEVTERLQSVATEAAARKAADDELRAIADEGLSKADASLSQIHEERQERAAQDRALAEAVSNERADRTEADTELQSQINGKQDNIGSFSADEKAAFLVSLGLGKIGVISQKQNWKSDYSSYTVSDVVKGIIPQYIIDHWISLSSKNQNSDGDVYFRFNEETGYFECNDLLDITLNDAILIMKYGDLGSYAKLAAEGKRVRVLFSAYLGAQFANDTCVGGGEFTERIFCQGIISISRCFRPKFNGYDMIALIKCKEILYLNLSTITKFHSFKRYYALTTFFGIKLAASATFQDSPFLSNESILFLIEHEASSSSITITLHASAYARAMADESILAALEAHTNISLASA